MGFGAGLQPRMDKRSQDQYRKRLVQLQQEMTALATRAVLEGRLADEEGTMDLADKAANAYTKEFLFHQSSNERSVLLLIEEALARIAAGRYGECQQCGEELDNKRLEAVPWARHCIPCQQKQDQGIQ